MLLINKPISNFWSKYHDYSISIRQFYNYLEPSECIINVNTNRQELASAVQLTMIGDRKCVNPMMALRRNEYISVTHFMIQQEQNVFYF